MSHPRTPPDTPERRVKAEASRYRPVSGDVLLAAIERVRRHRDDPTIAAATIAEIAEHLGFTPHSVQTRRGLAGELSVLVRHGYAEQSAIGSILGWRTTTKGRRRLAQARRSGRATLPESPQRRLWRHSRQLAQERLPTLRARASELAAELEAAARARNVDSATWGDLGERVRETCDGLQQASYTLHEWPEPDDASPDRGSWSQHLRSAHLRKSTSQKQR